MAKVVKIVILLKEKKMDQKQYLSGDEKNNKLDILKDTRISLKDTIDKEIKAMLNDEIRSAVAELADEQKLMIKQIVDEYKKAIEEQLVKEKTLIWAEKEEIRKSITGMMK